MKDYLFIEGVTLEEFMINLESYYMKEEDGLIYLEDEELDESMYNYTKITSEDAEEIGQEEFDKRFYETYFTITDELLKRGFVRNNDKGTYEKHIEKEEEEEEEEEE